MLSLPTTSETGTRKQGMLRTAFEGPVHDALEAAGTQEIIANPDGTVWIERAGSSRATSRRSGKRSSRSPGLPRLIAPSLASTCSSRRQRWLRTRCATATPPCQARRPT